MNYIPLETFFRLAALIGKESDPSRKKMLILQQADFQKQVYEGEAVVGFPPREDPKEKTNDN